MDKSIGWITLHTFCWYYIVLIYHIFCYCALNCRMNFGHVILPMVLSVMQVGIFHCSAGPMNVRQVESLELQVFSWSGSCFIEVFYSTHIIGECLRCGTTAFTKYTGICCTQTPDAIFLPFYLVSSAGRFYLMAAFDIARQNGWQK